MTPIAALFVETNGTYYGLPDVDPWDITRDARKYSGDDPVVAHPPCHLWVNLAAVNWKRYRRVLPAWYPGGNDGGCFAHALASIRRCGGVLEHPAFSHAWAYHGLTPRGVLVGLGAAVANGRARYGKARMDTKRANEHGCITSVPNLTRWNGRVILARTRWAGSIASNRRSINERRTRLRSRFAMLYCSSREAHR